jgi:hypothetical protein
VLDVAERLALAHQHARDPGRLGGDVERVLQRQPRRHGEAVLEIGVALAALRQVDGDEQHRAAGVARAADDLLAEAAVAEDVELEPERLLGDRAYVLDRADRHGGKRIDRALVLGGARRQHRRRRRRGRSTRRRDRNWHRSFVPGSLPPPSSAGGVDQHAGGSGLRAARRAWRPRVTCHRAAVDESNITRGRGARSPQVLDVGDGRHQRLARRNRSFCR